MVRPVLDAPASWEQAAHALAVRLAEPRAFPMLRAVHAPALEGGWALGAVDGGSALVLEGGGLAVGAVRAGALAWRRGALAWERAGPLEVRVLDDALAAELEGLLPGLPPPEGPAALLERLRARREWEHAMALAAQLGDGDVLALDGPLAQRDWPAALRAELARACARGGVLLAGVCKSTSTTLEGIPALLAAARAGRGVAEPWLAAIPSPGPDLQAVAARFLRGGRVFKVELWRSADPAEAVAKLAPWTLDAATPGYPFPLALAHNRCALDEGLVEDLAHALREAAGRRGVDADTWEEVFGDFHDVLDRGV
ncbi:MAG TPA: DNA double-strand break repair nuclease NurA [Candidatus Thermoplasmatota archaeon]|jgi:hypothetical protein|nr:DNA double-strand break repair nuclease NurA [Candidatus Thermoplasmatota archaeon]